jgi:hypothetical protein
VDRQLRCRYLDCASTRSGCLTVSVVSIGEAAGRVVCRTASIMALRQLLRGCPTGEHRRKLIWSALANGAIRQDEAMSLVREAA